MFLNECCRWVACLDFFSALHTHFPILDWAKRDAPKDIEKQTLIHIYCSKRLSELTFYYGVYNRIFEPPCQYNSHVNVTYICIWQTFPSIPRVLNPFCYWPTASYCNTVQSYENGHDIVVYDCWVLQMIMSAEMFCSWMYERREALLYINILRHIQFWCVCIMCSSKSFIIVSTFSIDRGQPILAYETLSFICIYHAYITHSYKKTLQQNLLVPF